MEPKIFRWSAPTSDSGAPHPESGSGTAPLEDRAELAVNRNKPHVMHIDLNSCFASVAQQGFPHLRGKPVVIAAYATNSGCVLSPSIEAKRFGIKTGSTVREAKLLCPDVVVRTADTVMVRDVHIKFKRIFRDYSPNVSPKSIDEAVLDFSGMEHIVDGKLEKIAVDIKRRLRAEVGEWIRCSIGISTNRFLAKVGANLQKPDGLNTITHANLREIYQRLSLVDLPGINKRNEARLNTCGIFTPLQFFEAPLPLLKQQVFQGIAGYYWYLRLRGYEIDAVDFKRKSFGQDYSLKQCTDNPRELARFLMKLCEKMGRRLRRHAMAASGIHVAVLHNDGTHWHRGRAACRQMYTTLELYKEALYLLNSRPEKKPVAKMGVSCYNLTPCANSQPTLFDGDQEKGRRLSDAVDRINDRYGEFVVTPALMMGMKDLIVDRIAFGAVKELEDLYESD